MLMVTITADLVKQLRERTCGGLLECKKALEAAGGDLEQAVTILRKTGKVKAEKKAGRVATEGVIAFASTPDAKTAFILEVNCETDFVAKDNNFLAFVDELTNIGLQAQAKDLNAFMSLLLPSTNKTVSEAREDLVAKIGENINIRRFAIISNNAAGTVGNYIHNKRIGVLVSLSVDDKILAKDIAMQIAATKPVAIDATGLAPEMLVKEKEIFLAQVQDSKKPPAIMEKMVQGRMQKFIDEQTLVNQQFIKNPEVKIQDLLKKAGARVLEFVRFEVGEGIEKEKADFAAEVKAQVERQT
jgi:elongation factor Ts